MGSEMCIRDRLSFVTGRLKRALHGWKLICVAQFIVEVIEFGYKLPFIHIPAPKVSRNYRSALTEKVNGPPRDLNYVLIRLAEFLIMMTMQLKMMCLRILMRHGALTQLIDSL